MSRYASDEGSNEIGVTFAPCKGEGGVEVGVNRVKTCGSWHSCLPCGARIAVHRARELAQAFETWETLGNSVVLATFTLQHHAGQSLRDLLVAQRAGWQALRSKRPYEADLLNLGWRRSRSSRRWDADGEGCDPGVRVHLRDDHGWHPHYHVFFLVEGGRDHAEAAREAVAPMWDRWSLAWQARGDSDRDGQRGVRRAGCEGDRLGQAASYGKYPFKLALEAVGGIFKHGRSQDRKGREVGHRHRTPAEIVEHIAVAQVEGKLGDEQAQTDLRVWREWCETATDLGLRQAPFPMRAWFADKARELGIEGPLTDGEPGEEKTDEQIAAAEVLGNRTGR